MLICRPKGNNDAANKKPLKLRTIGWCNSEIFENYRLCKVIPVKCPGEWRWLWVSPMFCFQMRPNQLMKLLCFNRLDFFPAKVPVNFFLVNLLIKANRRSKTLAKFRFFHDKMQELFYGTFDIVCLWRSKIFKSDAGKWWVWQLATKKSTIMLD